VTRKALGEMIKSIIVDEMKGVTSFAAEGDFVGYDPIAKIRGALLHWVAVPFNGVDVFCQLRCPNATQLEQCGDVTNIVLEDDGKPAALKTDDIIALRNYQEAVCRLVFNKPTFAEIGQIIDDGDFVVADKRGELRGIKKRFDEGKGDMTETEAAALATAITTLELELGFILPDDTMAFATQWAMGNDVSDVKRLTRDRLIKAAALAKASSTAPTDHISGRFTDFNRAEINACAFALLDECMRDLEARKKHGKREWLFGKGKRGERG